jgi:PAS domain S-box-containing protein
MGEPETEMVALERELSAIYANVPGILFYISVEPDDEFRFVSMSQAGLVATGLTEEQAMGARVRDVIPSPSLEMVLEHYREAIRTGQTVRWEETSVYPAGTRHGEVAVTPLVDQNGITTHLIGIVHDVTEKKRTDAALRESKARLEEADRRKDEFLAMLGHELRNPLAAIQMTAELLRLDGDAAACSKATDTIKRQTRQLSRMVDDLLEVSRITSGKFALKKERARVVSLLQHAVETARPLIESKGHQLNVLMPPEPVALDADPARLTQALVNLLTNAAKYTPPGGRISLSADQEEGKIVFRVKDTGIGVAPEMLKPIFELFVQASHPLDRSQGGLGLGLPIVRRIVEMHQGTVTAFSDGPGQGSEFVIRIPVGSAEPVQARHALPSPAREYPRRRILVVDDNCDLADGVAGLMTRWGHDTRVAYDGPNAVTVAAAFRPEVVFLDIGLPCLNGYEVAHRLRRLPELEGIALIALSGYGEPKDRQQSKEAGFDLHLVKPADLDRVEEVLASLAERPTGSQHSPTNKPIPTRWSL